MAKMYRTTAYGNEIKPYEVVKKTEKRVRYIDYNWREEKYESTEAITSSWHQWHESWDDAKAFLIERASCELSRAHAILDRCRSALQEAQSLKKKDQDHE